MTSPSTDLQRIIYERLIALQAVHDLVGDRIYDNRPAEANFPCITFGPSDVVEDDDECITGRIETIQLDCWSRDNARIAPVKRICDAVKTALHLYHADPGGSALVELRVTGIRHFIDSDGITAHGVIFVQAIIEE
jgi:hypothetical protein